MRRPADLALDLLDEFGDALGCRFSLFLLHPDEGRLVLLVGKPEIEAAVDQQRSADQADKQDRVFSEQAVSRRAVGNSHGFVNTNQSRSLELSFLRARYQHVTGSSLSS